MDVRLVDLLNDLAGSRVREEAWLAFVQFAKGLEVVGLNYSIADLKTGSITDMLSSMSQGYSKAYLSLDYKKICSSYNHCFSSPFMVPKVLSQEIEDKEGWRPNGIHEFREELSTFKTEKTIQYALPVIIGGDQCERGGLILRFGLSHKDTFSFLKSYGPTLSLGMNLLLTHLELPRKSMRTHCKRLTSREKEILLLLALGYRVQSLSEKIGISVNTVNFHLRNAKDKLNSATVTAAVARAIKEEILHL